MIKTIFFDLGNVVLTNEWHFESEKRDVDSPATSEVAHRHDRTGSTR